ncbi:MAG: acyl carrier protein [Candidatus Omnitrophica bacterium]|nr:acyl carrier protein [Candidatus Omnitrophota bacterium]
MPNSIEDQIKGIFKKVLDISPEEIKPNETLGSSLGIDSTELVEISVGIKKELGVALADSELKKTQTFNEIVKIVESKK